MDSAVKELLLLILPTVSSFMQVDKRILEAEYEVHTLYLDQDRSRLRYLLSIARMKWFLLTKPSYKRVAVWFADYHAAPAVLLSKWLGKKTLLFIGGYDAVRYPELKMGVYCSPLRRFCASLALRNCTHIVANHTALLSSENYYYNPSGHPEGIYRLLPNLSTPASVVFNAVPADAPTELNGARIRRILTVGGTPRWQDFYNKGYDLLLEVARRRPDMQFVFVGINPAWIGKLKDQKQDTQLPNVTIYEHLPHQQVLELMRESLVYAQPSISEGMPNALMEAMLQGCTPVGSKVAGIPTLIGDLGYVFSERSSLALEGALDEALSHPLDPATVSTWISTHFGFETRKQALLRVTRKYL